LAGKRGGGLWMRSARQRFESRTLRVSGRRSNRQTKVEVLVEMLKNKADRRQREQLIELLSNQQGA
jgi:hypothetical protein